MWQPATLGGGYGRFEDVGCLCDPGTCEKYLAAGYLQDHLPLRWCSGGRHLVSVKQFDGSYWSSGADQAA